MYACMHVCMHACMCVYVSVRVCMYVGMRIPVEYLPFLASRTSEVPPAALNWAMPAFMSSSIAQPPACLHSMGTLEILGRGGGRWAAAGAAAPTPAAAATARPCSTCAPPESTNAGAGLHPPLPSRSPRPHLPPARRRRRRPRRRAVRAGPRPSRPPRGLGAAKRGEARRRPRPRGRQAGEAQSAARRREPVRECRRDREAYQPPGQHPRPRHCGHELQSGPKPICLLDPSR